MFKNLSFIRFLSTLYTAWSVIHVNLPRVNSAFDENVCSPGEKIEIKETQLDIIVQANVFHAEKWQFFLSYPNGAQLEGNSQFVISLNDVTSSEQMKRLSFQTLGVSEMNVRLTWGNSSSTSVQIEASTSDGSVELTLPDGDLQSIAVTLSNPRDGASVLISDLKLLACSSPDFCRLSQELEVLSVRLGSGEVCALLEAVTVSYCIGQCPSYDSSPILLHELVDGLPLRHDHAGSCCVGKPGDTEQHVVRCPRSQTNQTILVQQFSQCACERCV